VIEADFIVRGKWLLTMNASCDIIEDGAIAVKDGKISFVGGFKDLSRACVSGRVFGSSDMAVMPGLINCHTHAAMVYMRGLADDLPLTDWLEGYIWPTESKWLSPEFASDATELAVLEMLKSGITTYVDMYFYEEQSAHVAKRLGIRAVLGVGIVNFPTKTGSGRDDYLKNAEEFIKKWQADDLIVPSIAPHSTYACSPETISQAVEIVKKYGSVFHTHLLETEKEASDVKKRYGLEPLEILQEAGALDIRALLVHCVWLKEKDIEILSGKNASVVHCPESNLKLASGIAPVPKMLRAGLRVVLGTDGAASNNNLDMFGEIATAAKLHKGVSNDPTSLDSRTALCMATRWAADALGLGSKIGSLEVGKSADIVMIDLRRPHLSPLYNIESQIVYSLRACDVDMVFVGGKLLIEGGRPLTVDEKDVLLKAERWRQRLIHS